MSNVVLFPKPYIARNPKPGDRVWHHAAGWGTVLKIKERGLALTVKFDNIKEPCTVWVSYFKKRGYGPAWRDKDHDGGDAA